MPDAGLAISENFGVTRQFLTFRVSEQLYALPADELCEIIRIPALARVPHAPKSLLGLGNLRGAVLPVASLRGLLGKDGGARPEARAMVLDGAAPVAVAVDAVEGLVSVDAGAIEIRQAEIASEEGEKLRGAFQTGTRGEIAKILDIAALLQSAFVQRERPQHWSMGAAEVPAVATGAKPPEKVEKLLTFEIAGQEYGLPLSAVQQIVSAPETLAVVPRVEAVVLGVMAYRGALLPLLSLRGLLGFASAAGRNGREKVVVTKIAGVLVGLMADRMRAIVQTDPSLVDPTPPILAARTGGESRINAIYRGNGGKRLIPILGPDQLFREDIMQRLGERATAAADVPAGNADTPLQLLVFRLGDDEFGVPIAAVEEVARVPDQVTRVPNTPKFLEGVVNLRGQVLPVIDQRRRFDMLPSERREGRRLLILRAGKHRAGLIVDSVSEVLRTVDAAVAPAPHLTGAATRLVHGVINLEAAGRMVLLLDPAELLTRAERGILDAFQGDADRAAS